MRLPTEVSPLTCDSKSSNGVLSDLNADTDMPRAPLRRTKSSLLAFKLREVRADPGASRFGTRALSDWGATRPSTPHPSDAATLAARSSCAQFLNKKDDDTAHELPLPCVAEESSPPRKRPSTGARLHSQKAHPDSVWVDCFYYGFYMPKSKLPAFQASLQQQHKPAWPQAAAAP